MFKQPSTHTPDTEEAIHATIQIMGRSEFQGTFNDNVFWDSFDTRLQSPQDDHHSGSPKAHAAGHSQGWNTAGYQFPSGACDSRCSGNRMRSFRRA